MDRRFPNVTGSNLLREKVNLPQDFAGRLNLVFVAFQQWHQSQVDSWAPLAQELEKSVPGLRYYELPTIWEMNRINRWFINEGMRAGIRNQTTRSKTITLYIDKPAFRAALGMPHENEIYVLLLDDQGKVLWMAEGALDATKDMALREAILRALAPDR